MSKKIDAMVAEKVMGWMVSRELGKRWRVPLESPFFRDFDDSKWPNCPAFSTDISAAWEAISTFTDVAIEKSGCGWWVRISGAFEANTPECGEPIELTMCRAMLRAKGVTESEIQEALK